MAFLQYKAMHSKVKCSLTTKHMEGGSIWSQFYKQALRHCNSKPFHYNTNNQIKEISNLKSFLNCVLIISFGKTLNKPDSITLFIRTISDF